MATEFTSTPPFSWVPFYEELAERLRPYADPGKQRDLIRLLEDLRSRGLTITPLEDKDETGRRFLMEELDPFTFFGTFNRGLSDKTRVRILQELKSFFGVTAPVPSGFAGIPVLNNMSSWFVAYRADRGLDDVARLWSVFELALRPNPLANSALGEAFDRALEVRGTNFNLTMGLFWIRPRLFLSLDSVMRAHLEIDVPREGLSFDFYRRTLERVRASSEKELPELSSEAWSKDQPPPDEKVKPPPKIASSTEYWLVGAYWWDSNPHDQTDRFLAEGIWENGYSDRYLDIVRQMKPGDRIGIKAVTTQKIGLPFDNHGETVSKLILKARGTIVRNAGDGRTVEVEWEPRTADRDWYFYTWRRTVWHVRKDQDMAQRLIRFAFSDEAQDYEWFASLWWPTVKGKERPKVPIDLDVDEAQPYAVADVLAEGVFLSENEIRKALSRLDSKKAVVLQGAPGVGKTFLARKLAYALMEARDDRRITMVQFHPSFCYEDFVRGFRPTGQAGGFELKDGPFVRLCAQADADPDHHHVLIIDEINRGHLSQIFGELFMLLEGDKRGPKHALTPLYRRTDDETFHVPDNLYVIGTMNIADRSLALVDFALRRRFAFVTLEPQFANPRFRTWLLERKMPEVLFDRIVKRMTALNARIADDTQLGTAFRLGHSFFCPRGDDFSALDDDWFQAVVETEIVPLLEEYWHDAPEKVTSAADELRG